MHVKAAQYQYLDGTTIHDTPRFQIVPTGRYITELRLNDSSENIVYTIVDEYWSVGFC